MNIFISVSVKRTPQSVRVAVKFLTKKQQDTLVEKRLKLKQLEMEILNKYVMYVKSQGKKLPDIRNRLPAAKRKFPTIAKRIKSLKEQVKNLEDKAWEKYKKRKKGTNNTVPRPKPKHPLDALQDI